jgi:hypothetical protein
MSAEDRRETPEQRNRPDEHDRARGVMAVSEQDHRQRRDDHGCVANLFEARRHEPSARLTKVLGGGRSEHQHGDADHASSDEEHGENRHDGRSVQARLRLAGRWEAVATVG